MSRAAGKELWGQLIEALPSSHVQLGGEPPNRKGCLAAQPSRHRHLTRVALGPLARLALPPPELFANVQAT